MARVEAKKDTQSLDNKVLLDYAKELAFYADDNRKTLKDLKSEYIKMKPIIGPFCHNVIETDNLRLSIQGCF